jgi:hypothetical protein
MKNAKLALEKIRDSSLSKDLFEGRWEEFINLIICGVNEKAVLNKDQELLVAQSVSNLFVNYEPKTIDALNIAAFINSCC